MARHHDEIIVGVGYERGIVHEQLRGGETMFICIVFLCEIMMVFGDGYECDNNNMCEVSASVGLVFGR